MVLLLFYSKARLLYHQSFSEKTRWQPLERNWSFWTFICDLQVSIASNKRPSPSSWKVMILINARASVRDFTVHQFVAFLHQSSTELLQAGKGLLHICVGQIYIQVTPMLSIKFRVNWPFGSGEEAKNKFSRWRLWRPSWILDQNDFSCFWSTSHPDASYQVYSQLAQGYRRSRLLKQLLTPHDGQQTLTDHNSSHAQVS